MANRVALAPTDGARLRLAALILPLWCLAIALFLSPGILPAATAPALSGPLSCVAAPHDDPAPWIWRARILASFPPDTPRPEFLGGFRDKNSRYELHLWRDAQGIFGELLSPILEADSPASRLYDARFDGKTETVSFTARFPDGERRLAGRLGADSLTATIEHANHSDKIILRKLPINQVHGVSDGAYSSRAQFECAMILFRSY